MRRSTILLLILSLLVPFLFLGCADDGSDGASGLTTLTRKSDEPAGANCLSGGTKIEIGLDQDRDGILDNDEVDPANTQYVCSGPLEASAESCATCHDGVPRDGDAHQARYNSYTNAPTFAVTIDNVSSVDNTAGGGGYNVTLTFTITQNGQPYIDAAKLPSLNQKTFYAVQYDSATRQFIKSKSFPSSSATPTGTPGQYTVFEKGFAFAPETSNALAYLYIAKDDLGVPKHGRITLYDEVVNVGRAFGDVVTYESAANLESCEKCHGKPYGKHGYRQAALSGQGGADLPDFIACKTCHYDTRDGSHFGWQLIMDNPPRWAEVGDDVSPAEKIQYAYKASVMNDVHMSHAMEFPYPQSMANCVMCHEGKLDVILTDTYMTLTTCKSCHPVTGSTAYSGGIAGNGMIDVHPEDNPATATLALETIIPHDIDNLIDGKCTPCHADVGGIEDTFAKIHSGYDKKIYTAAGQKYGDAITVSIDQALFDADNNILTFSFSASEVPDLPGVDVANIKPTVLVGLYGWDTKDFIVNPHDRDPDRNRLLEAEVGSEHPRISSVATGATSWDVTVDLSLWADKIADGTVKKLEIGITSEINTDNGQALALNAVSRTFDLGTNAFFDNYFQGDNKIVDVENCNACHDTLATTFHEESGRGGNVVACRLCHTVRNAGSHMEMQSRSIESYVHAIHSFQVFDLDEIDFTDPVKAKHYEDHVSFVYPLFTTENCESCHVKVDPPNPGKYNVPDQTLSLPGLISRSTNAVDDEDYNFDRNIGFVPEYVTGPAFRACGACHRAHLITANHGKGDAAKLASFYGHGKSFGILFKNDDDDVVLDTVIETIMAMF